MQTPWDYWTNLNKKEGKPLQIEEILGLVNAAGKKRWPSFTLQYDCLKKVLASPWAKTQYYNLSEPYRIAIADAFGTTQDKIKWHKKKLIRKRKSVNKFE